MHIIQLDRITVNHAGRDILRDFTWAIGDRDRCGLVGPNGAGKSSLLKVIAGQIQPTTGVVATLRGAQIGYLPQDVELPPGCTLLEAALRPPPRLAEAEARLEAAEARLGRPDIYNYPDRLERALNDHEQALAAFERLGGARHRSRVLEALHALGFGPEDFDRPAETLSGGQKKLALLARLAVEQPALLLLDEPDNHLDLRAKAHLGRFIRDYAGAVVLVSHDRYLLDEAVIGIAELADGRLTLYAGGYSAYAIERELARQRQQQLYIAQQKRIQQIEAAIHEWEQKARADLNERFARQARSRRRMLERMEARGEIVARVSEHRPLDLQFDGWRGSRHVLEIKRLAMAFDDNWLFLDVNLLLRHGERAGLVGPNGAGKSVLFKLILGELEPLAGEIRLGPSVRVGYYSQEHQTLGDWLARTPLDLVRHLKPMSEGDGVAFLVKMLFRYEQTRQPIGTLSGGERSRLQLAGLMLQQPNLLLLDEPTNNLDIPSVEALERALDDFEGALLVISHDRMFLDRVVDQIVELENGALTAYPGGYSDYLAYKAGRAESQR